MAFYIVAVLWTPLGSVKLVVGPGLLAFGIMEYARRILWQRLLAADKLLAHV